MRSLLRLDVDARSPIPVRRPLAYPLSGVSDGAGLPRGDTPPGIPALVGGLDRTPSTVVLAIENLKRSGYRPLHSGLTAPEPSSVPQAAPVREDMS